MKNILCAMFVAVAAIAPQSADAIKPQTDAGAEVMLKARKAVYDPGRNPMYRKGWIDFNKNGRMDIYEDPSADISARVEDLLSQMTIDEKTCQMVTLYGYGRVLKDELPTPEWKNSLWKDGIGAIDEHLNGFRNWSRPLSDSPYVWPASRHAAAINEVQRFFVEQTRLGIPADFTNEGIRGVEAYRATDFPTQLGLGHTWNRDLIRKVGEITGREARLLGYTNIYAPILDVGRDQRWGRYEEVYGEDPYLVAELGVQMVEGLQHNFQVAATGKHFVAYSNNKGAREGMARVDPQMSPHEVENIHVYPWREVIARAGLLGVMCSYNDYDGEPVQGSHYWLTERLRNDFGFCGYTVSDSDAVEYLHSKHRVSENMKESVRQAVEAGLNVRCTFRSPDSYVLPLRELVAEGKLSEKVIDQRVRDILRVKFIVGLFDDPYSRDLAAADAEVDSEQNNLFSLQASRESIVLLKNNGVLPFDVRTLKSVAVVGPNADEVSYAHTHYGPLASEVTSVLAGIRNRLGDERVVYAKGCELVDDRWPLSEILPEPMNDAELAMIAEAVRVAEKSDVVIAVMGGGVRTCGENKSRTSLELPGRQNDLLRALKATGKPLVVVLINGRPLSVNYADAAADAILEAWYPGGHGGTAVAEILTGDCNPSGKLTVTFPRTVGQIPFNFPFKPYSQVDGNSRQGVTGNQTRVNGALYNFGHGLSYTTYEYSDIQLSKRVIRPDESVEVSFTVKNTGSRDGDEVVQLYIRDRVSSITVYERQLRGFERVHIPAGESREVKMTLTSKDLSLLDRSMKHVVEEGDFDIMIGASSTDIRLQSTITVAVGGDAGNVQPAVVKLPQRLARGESFTLRLASHEPAGRLVLDWVVDGLCRYEITYTNGGGQFLPIFNGEVSQSGRNECRFEPVHASEIRITVMEGAGTLCAIEGVKFESAD